MKSVLHLRIDSPGYNSNAMMHGFIENNYEYFGLDWQRERFEDGVEQLRDRAISMADEIRPSICFANIQSSEALDLETYKELAKITFVINYTFDVRDSARTEWLYEAAPFVGFTLFGCQEDVVRCNLRGIRNVGLLQSSFDPNIFKPKKDILKYAFDVVFCGTNYVGSNLEFPLAHERQRMIEFLQKNYESKFMAYGHAQPGGLIRTEVEASVYNYSRLAIAQNNFERTNYSSDRLWKIMGAGTMCLCKYFPGLENLFKKEVELDWWHNFDELKDLIDFYLSDDVERQSIADAGCTKVRAEHTWRNRIEEMENIIYEYKNSLLLN